MRVAAEFDAWAADGRDRGMAERHWHTAKHALARMPIEPGDRVLDLGTGSGYALRALLERDIGRGYGLDGSPAMVERAREYTEVPRLAFLVGDFGGLPFRLDSLDHAFSMEAFYYAADPHVALEELYRVIRPGGTVYLAVNYYEENVYSHDWQVDIDVEMTRWSSQEYREALEGAGFHVAEQDNIPDRDIDIPPADSFPTEGFETRAEMVERYRRLGTLLTVGVVPE
ncbi:MAG: class I SAM-dependent methyltransferase [Halodesulfurarchaeum sp.]